jgi:Eukaryotic aspartyl protease
LTASSIGGTDTFNLASTGELSQFPLGIPRAAWDGGYTTLHALGLGSNSTFLNALKAQGRIAARVWSIYWGRMWTTSNPVDGTVVIGGYDKRKVLGQNHTQALDYRSTGCWTGMRLDISDIKVNFRSGKDISIFPANTVLPSCIVPQRQLMVEMPGFMYKNFESATNTTNIGPSFGLHWSAFVFDTPSA